ncbi:uncharacterized protein EI97DRAFT_431647 [Westerdykella ornata]|uniref:Peptidase S54 rhomboid domain-containing protein n=1 Tax=Westerdykella ornata TaxID=318751 RepID=A0A6A6JPX3_WESOR|nr:uncharacterized protein EI97DRAFT_431647 [Westerdykella ornata]KAF2278427.1 hypothetical protein EI97DRAFT_431647 [Westerdykella ornata]
MASLFRLVRPLCPHTLRPLRPSLAPRFFSPSTTKAFGLAHGPSRFLNRQPSAILRRLYARNHNQGWGPSSPPPPPPSGNPYENAQANMRIIYLFAAINTAVWAYAAYCKICAQQGNPQPWMQLAPRVLLNLRNVLSGHYETIITSAFAHLDPIHLLANMTSFYFIGRLVAENAGIMPRHFVTLLLGSAISGSLGYLLVRYQHVRRTGQADTQSGLGFSGAVMGLGLAASMMFPRTVFHVYGIIPVPLWVLMGGYLIYDGYYLSSEKKTGVAHAGHLGGAAFGALYYLLVLRRPFLRLRL